MRVLVVLAIAGVLGIWNYATFQGMMNPAAAEVAAAENSAAQEFARQSKVGEADAIQPLAWSVLEKSRAGSQGATPYFPDELKALDGKEVVVAGVFSTLATLSENKTARGGFLQPPSKFQCCGVTCDPRTQLLVFVDCSAQPWSFSADRTLVQVRGRLKLETEDTSWGLFSLGEARIETLAKAP